MLTSELCPSCGRTLSAALNAVVTKTSGYSDCLRRCDKCEVGFSNAKTAPTVIWRNPVMNVPPSVQAGVLGVLRGSLNQTNLNNKVAKFGYSTSEDAVTWTVFAWLALQPTSVQAAVFSDLLGLPLTSAPSIALWGVEISHRTEQLRARLEDISDRIGEDPRRRTEPDLVVDFGDEGVAMIEVKYRSGNDVQETEDSKWDKYVLNHSAFANGNDTRKSGFYELARNWRFGWDLASDRPMRLVNLGRSSLFTGSKAVALNSFEQTLATSARAKFIRSEWPDFLDSIAQHTAPMPLWLSQFVTERELR